MVRVYKYKNKVDARGNISYYKKNRDDPNLKYEDGEEVFSGSVAECEDYLKKLGQQKLNDLKLKNPDGEYSLLVEPTGGYFNRYDTTDVRTRCSFVIQIAEDTNDAKKKVVFEEHYRIMSDDEAEKDVGSVTLKDAKLYGYSAAQTLSKIRDPDFYRDIPFLFDSVITTYSDAYRERYMKILNSSDDEKLFDDNSEWSLKSENENTPGYNIARLLKTVAAENIYLEISENGEYPYEDDFDELELDPEPVDDIIVSQENQEIEGTMLVKRLTFDIEIDSSDEFSGSVHAWNVSATYEHLSKLNGSLNQLSNLYYVLLEIIKSMYESSNDVWVSSDIDWG